MNRKSTENNNNNKCTCTFNLLVLIAILMVSCIVEPMAAKEYPTADSVVLILKH